MSNSSSQHSSAELYRRPPHGSSLLVQDPPPPSRAAYHLSSYLQDVGAGVGNTVGSLVSKHVLTRRQLSPLDPELKEVSSNYSSQHSSAESYRAPRGLSTLVQALPKRVLRDTVAIVLTGSVRRRELVGVKTGVDAPATTPAGSVAGGGLVELLVQLSSAELYKSPRGLSPVVQALTLL